MDTKTKMSYAAAILLALTLSFASLVAFAKNDNAQNGSQKEKTEKTAQAEKKNSQKAAEMKNFEKPDTSKGQTNAQVHKEKVKEVAKNLKKVAAEEEIVGNTEVSEAIEEVVAEQEAVQEETAAAIEAVEGRGKVKTFLVGTDYKNLGQLRSNLVQNRNEIRKLTRTMTQAQTPESAALVQEQLMVLTQERERIKNIISTNEDSFSLFGWVARFLFNYEQAPINEEEESELAEEVEEAIESAPETTADTSTETAENTETASETPETSTETAETSQADTAENTETENTETEVEVPDSGGEDVVAAPEAPETAPIQ